MKDTPTSRQKFVGFQKSYDLETAGVCFQSTQHDYETQYPLIANIVLKIDATNVEAVF